MSWWLRVCVLVVQCINIRSYVCLFVSDLLPAYSRMHNKQKKTLIDLKVFDLKYSSVWGLDRRLSVCLWLWLRFLSVSLSLCIFPACCCGRPSVALTAFCDPPFSTTSALSSRPSVSMLANEDPLSKVCCKQNMPLFYFIFVFFFSFFLFPFSSSIFLSFLFLLSFCSFVWFFPFLSVSFHSGRPPKYSTTNTTTISGSTELGCNPLLSPTSSLPDSPAPERPDTGGFPLPVHPHSLPQPSPSSGDVSSQRAKSGRWC